jgi:hypothetical protein
MNEGLRLATRGEVVIYVFDSAPMINRSKSMALARLAE